MIFYINTLLPALEVNGMALLQEKPMVEVLTSVAHTATLQIGKSNAEINSPTLQQSTVTALRR